MANAAPAIPIDASGTDSPATPDQPIIERISSLDFIRGIAIVGILWANILGYSRPGIEEMPWGSREMSIKDPFGNRLTFTELVSEPPGT